MSVEPMPNDFWPDHWEEFPDGQVHAHHKLLDGRTISLGYIRGEDDMTLKLRQAVWDCLEADRLGLKLPHAQS